LKNICINNIEFISYRWKTQISYKTQKTRQSE
jgi:hypothetical protein